MKNCSFRKKIGILFFLGSLLASGYGAGVEPAPSGESFFRKGDRWLLTGDSITFTDTYREVVKRVMDHFHPDNGISFPNRAVWGVESDFKTDVPDKPTVVSIMLGMNDIIHNEWGSTPDYSKKVNAYRERIRRQIRRYKKLGAEVLLFTPTLTDERISSFFSPMNTRPGLEKFGEVIRELGRTENCVVVPMAEELEAYEKTLGPNEMTRPDGVHPFGYGQYQLAWTLIRTLNVPGALTGKRASTVNPPPELPIRVRKAVRFLNQPEEKVVLEMDAEKPLTAVLTWSLGKERGSETISLKPGKNSWTLPASNEAYRLKAGERRQAVIDLSSGKGRSLFMIDLARTKVLKPVNGELSFEIRAPEKGAPWTHSLSGSTGARPEGDPTGTVRIRENGPELWFSGRVFDQEICSQDFWITGRDNVRIMFDFRPAERFGSLTPDRDTAMILLSPREKPEFSMLALAWWGPRFQYALHSAGKQETDGYSWLLGFAGNVTDYTRFDIRKLDYYGFNLAIIDRDSKSFTLHSAMLAEFDVNVEKGLNQLMIVDRKNRFPSGETTTVQCFGR